MRKIFSRGHHPSDMRHLSPELLSQRLFRSLSMLFLSLLVFMPVSIAQITNVAADQQTPTPGVGHDYIQMLSETVDPSTGALSIRINVPMPKGRGLTLPFAIAYDSNGLHLPYSTEFTMVAWTSDVSPLSKGGWGYTVPMLSFISGSATDPNHIFGTCSWTSNFMFQDPLGGRHALGMGTANGTKSGTCPFFSKTNVLSGGDDFYSSTTGTIVDRDGTLYNFAPFSFSGSAGNGTASAPSTVEDRNGNIIAITGTSSGSFAFTDSLGRAVLASNGFGATGNTLTVSGLANPYTVTWGTATFNFNVGVYNPYPSSCPNGFGPATGTIPVIRSMQLPNGQRFNFTYDSDDPTITHPFGVISQVTYPSGGWVKYIWALNPLATAGLFTDQNNTAVCTVAYDTPAIAKRTVSFDGTNPALVQTFNYSTARQSGNPSWSTKQTTVTTQDLSVGETFETDYSYIPGASTQTYPNTNSTNGASECGLGSCEAPVESSVVYKDTNGAILKTVTKTWQDTYLPTDETTQLGTGSSAPTSDVHYSYYPAAQGFQLQEKDEYDFGSGAKGPLLRKTIYNYASFPATPIFPSSPSIFDRPSSIITYDGNNNRVAETDYFYDQTAVASVSNLPTGTHDETNYGTSYNNRGNATTATRKCLQSCADSVSTLTYDETGQALTSKDANSNTTNYSYADSYDSPPSSNTNAYLTKVTRPTTNGVNHIETYKYAYSDGQLIQATDENTQVITYVYNDSLRRPTETDYPDGGKTTIAYNDAPYNPTTPSPSVTTMKLMTSTPSVTYLTTLTAFDGLGHAVRSVLTSDPDCFSGDRTDTTYDGLGRVHQVSNPYCTSSDPTYGLTTYSYDALSRTTQVTHPDNSTILTTYTGRATQVQDEGNGTQRVTRISQVDGLGRLTSVCEAASAPFVGAGGASSSSLIGSGGTPVACGQDIAGTGFLSTYQYDTLGNLLQVNQTGIGTRTFTYDSLSRLLTAFNPESGSISYIYDANGNLLTKTAPAPNQTGTATVTTCFGSWNGTSCGGTGYDALNRLTQKSYSDGTTPTVSFFYDSPVGGYTTNLIGRLVESSVAMPPSTAGCIYTVSEYDPMGRISNQFQAVPAHTCTGYGLPYTYDLMGNMTFSKAPYEATFTYTYNTAARLTAVTDSISDANDPPNVFSNARYNAAGQITSDTLGTGELETYTYTKRNQWQAVSSVLNTSTIYSFSLGLAPNGNILSANDSANGNWNYSYDQFNRLVCANLVTNGTCATPPTGTPSYTYVYDRFGNRWQQNGSHSMQLAFTGNNPGNPQNNNRMDGYSYDAAGNLLNDGVHNYFYNAENQLIQMDGSAGYCYSGTGTAATACYLYDADGRRVYRKPDPTTCDSTYHITDIIYDLSDRPIVNGSGANGNACIIELYAGSRHLAMQGGGIWFYHSDWLGTVRTTLNYQNRNLGPSNCSSLPFGDGLSCTPNFTANIYHFTGKERDSESGLDNFGARYNASSFGRFTSADDTDADDHTSDPQGLNLYAYVQNNPTNATDPDGHDCVLIGGNSAQVTSGTCDGIKGGTYVPGIIDRKTGNYDPNTNTLTFSYTPYGGGNALLYHMGGVYPTHPGTTEFEKFAHRMSNGADQLNYLSKQVALQALGRVQGVIFDAAAAALLARLAAGAGADLLASRPAWAKTAGGFVNWLKNLEKAKKQLSSEEADAVISEAQSLGVKVRLDPPHPTSTNWNVPHLNIGQANVHLEVPAGYSNPTVPVGHP